MTQSYEKNRTAQQAELAFMIHVADFRRRLADARKASKPERRYKYLGDKLVNIETEAKVAAGIALVALQAEIGVSII